MDHKEEADNPLSRKSVAELIGEVVALEQDDVRKRNLAAIDKLLQDLDAQNRSLGRPTKYRKNGHDIKKTAENRKETVMKDMICICWVLNTINIHPITSLTEATSATVVIKDGKLFIPIIIDNTWYGEFKEKATPRKGYIERIMEIVKEHGYGIFQVKNDENNLPVIVGPAPEPIAFRN